MSCPAQHWDEFSAADVTRVTGACSSWGKQRIILAFSEITLPAYLFRTFICHQSIGNEAPVLLAGPSYQQVLVFVFLKEKKELELGAGGFSKEPRSGPS